MDNQLIVFYSCLVLVAALRPPKPRNDRSSHPKAGWRRFLDDLCWFCDTETGGKSVVSIMTQQLRNESIIWLACNADTTKPIKYLKWLLHKLTNAHLLSPSQVDKLEADIIAESVRISHKKIKYYARLLEIGLEKVAAARGGRKACSLEESLTRLLKDRPYPCKLSIHAYAFRKDPLYAILKQRASDDSALATHWIAIRHHVGRLASWAKSTKSFIRMAQNEQLQKFLAVAKCCAVPQMEVLTGNVIEHREQYSDLLKRVFPELDSGLLHYHFKTCTSNDASVLKLISHIHEKNPSPFVHAEIVTLERALLSGFTFAIDEYIACSKPPCYCCCLWAKFRSRRIEMRPGHGNAYVKWAPPLVCNMTNTQRSSIHRAFSSMLNEMKYTARDHLFQESNVGKKAPDSATDISTTLPSVQNLSLVSVDIETSSHRHEIG